MPGESVSQNHTSGCQNTKATDAMPKDATPTPEEQDECSLREYRQLVLIVTQTIPKTHNTQRKDMTPNRGAACNGVFDESYPVTCKTEEHPEEHFRFTVTLDRSSGKHMGLAVRTDPTQKLLQIIPTG